MSVRRRPSPRSTRRGSTVYERSGASHLSIVRKRLSAPNRGSNPSSGLTRRAFLTRGAKAGVAIPVLGSWLAACDAGDTPDVELALDEGETTEITIAINESPWLASFEAIVDVYEEQTGNTVNLRVFDFGGLLTQQINAMEQQSDEFDIFNINEGWVGQFFDRGWVTPLREIDPDFEWDENWIEYDGAGRWDGDARANTVDGEPMALPINGNIHLFQYRRDLYEELGLEIPETFDDAIANGQEAMDADAIDYGYVIRGEGDIGGYAVTFNFGPLLHGYGEDWFADSQGGDFTPTINSDTAKEAMAKYLELGELGPSNPQTVGQAEMLSLLQTGQSLQCHMVSATYATLEDPADSVVAGNVGYTLVPKGAGGRHAPHSGIWVMGVPPQVDESQKRAAYNFLRWLMEFESQMEYAEHGGIVTRQDVYESELADEDEYRYMQGVAESSEHIVGNIKYWFSQEMLEMTERRISEIVAGDLDIDEGMETMAEELEQIADAAGAG